MSREAEVDFYCPSCAAAATTGTTYCKDCGTDVRYVPRAMEGGGLTARQRSFVATLGTLPPLIYGAAAAIPGAMADGLDIAIAGIWASLLAGVAVRLAYMVARDGSSADSIFRRVRPGRMRLASAPVTKRLSGATDDDAPTKRL
jgi:hypothetical protein